MRGRPPRSKSKARTSRKVGQTSRWLGQRVRELRLGLGWTQEQAAARAGIVAKHLQEVEAGMANPTLSTIVGIAHGLSVPLSLLLAGVDQSHGNRLLPDIGTEASKKRRGSESDNVRFVPIRKEQKRAPGEKFPMLTPPEQKVFDLLVFEGLEDTEIAERLGFVLPTTRFYVMSIRRKFGARDRLALVVAYWKARLAAMEREERERRRRHRAPSELPQDEDAEDGRK